MKFSTDEQGSHHATWIPKKQTCPGFAPHRSRPAPCSPHTISDRNHGLPRCPANLSSFLPKLGFLAHSAFRLRASLTKDGSWDAGQHNEWGNGAGSAFK